MRALILCLLAGAGCDGSKPIGEGSFSGTLLDVTIRYGKFCEIRQTGATFARDGQGRMQQTNDDKASSMDIQLCKDLKKAVGKNITINYDEYAWKPNWQLETNYIVKSFTVAP